jgi:diadenosine tetraphosphate (Ap4A) HIT family hydrolase
LARKFCIWIFVGEAQRSRATDQVVDHVHFHIIPKTAERGLTMEWESYTPEKEDLATLAKELSDKIAKL